MRVLYTVVLVLTALSWSCVRWEHCTVGLLGPTKTYRGDCDPHYVKPRND